MAHRIRKADCDPQDNRHQRKAVDGPMRLTTGAFGKRPEDRQEPPKRLVPRTKRTSCSAFSSKITATRDDRQNGNLLRIPPSCPPVPGTKRHRQFAGFPPAQTHISQIEKFKWCPGAESNHRHEDFQSTALPLSYPGTGDCVAIGVRRFLGGLAGGVQRLFEQSGQCGLRTSSSSASSAFSISSGSVDGTA